MKDILICHLRQSFVIYLQSSASKLYHLVPHNCICSDLGSHKRERARSPARQSDSDDIVAQLISENTRLNDEVQRLMVMVQAAQYQQPQAPQQTQRVPQQQQQQERGTAAASTEELQGQQKYVCCGTCRQWLQAPHDAQMVRCPGCGCINNCDLAPQNASRVAAQERACMTLCKSLPTTFDITTTTSAFAARTMAGLWLMAVLTCRVGVVTEDEISELIPSFMQDCLGGLWNAGAHLLNNSSSDWRHPRRHTEAPPGDSTIFRKDSSWHSYHPGNGVRAQAVPTSQNDGFIELQGASTGVERPERTPK